MARVFISYRHVDPDQAIAQHLAQALAHHEVFIDTNIRPGEEWGNLIDTHLEDADFLIAIVSEASAGRDTVVEEVRRAHEAYLARKKPAVIPVRLGAISRLPYPLSAYISRFQHVEWNSAADTPRVIDQIRGAIEAPRIAGRPASQRLQMIERVRADWIKGVLQNSLYQVARIDLGIRTAPGAVERGLDVVVQRPDEEPADLAPGSRLLPVFDEHLGQLLILGAPGSGKTTLLLELAKDLLDRAEADEGYRIPVIFNLSSWALRREPLDRWMADEMRLRSDVPAKLAREWVANEQILPLLDGLDEVAAAHRQACVEAINTYRADHGWVEMAICSRIAEYEALSAKLNLPAALMVQPLNRAQVEQYLELAGPKLEGVRKSVRSDPELWELLETPLMLSVVALACKDAPAGEIDLGGGTANQRLRRLYDRYVDAMFRRRARETRYTPAQIREWLGWLAAGMVRRSQTLFQIEDLQPAWLGSWAAQAAVMFLVASVVALISGVLGRGILALDSAILDRKSLLYEWRDAADSTVYLSAIGGAIALLRSRSAAPVDLLEFRWPGFLPFLLSCVKWAAIGAVFGGTAGGVACGTVGTDFMQTTWSVAVASLIPFGAAGAMSALLQGRVAGARSAPQVVLARSFYSTLICAGGSFFVSLVFFLLIYNRLSGFDVLQTDLYFLGWVGIFFALEKGGYFLLNHYATRLLLRLRHVTPWNVVRFLDAAAERIFLRKVGGGYIFVHRTLLEYFAGLRAPAE